MKEYRLFVQSMYDRSIGFYETYGISVFESGEMTRIIRDISLERDKVEALADRFNAEEPNIQAGSAASESCRRSRGSRLTMMKSRS